MKRIHAYVLAADPTWLEASVLAYYPWIERLVVSFDRDGVGYTGAKTEVEECLERLKRIDGERKIRWAPGSFHERRLTPMQNETRQRNAAMELAQTRADWVLQVDTDEWIPEMEYLLEGLDRAERAQKRGLEWPMRVLFRRLRDGSYLEVCGAEGEDHFEYVAPLAVRAGTRLVEGRRTGEGFLRAVIRGDGVSHQLRRALEPGEERALFLGAEAAVVHNSWAREPAQMRRKLATWSHACGRAWLYYALRWWPAPWIWQGMRDFHPFSGPLWPALRRCGARLPVMFPGGRARLSNRGAARAGLPRECLQGGAWGGSFPGFHGSPAGGG
ncbi:MAG: hypothetical protein RLZZ142_280 [Verrucomicrobiota bacterium]|jgi:hypothetical protein